MGIFLLYLPVIAVAFIAGLFTTSLGAIFTGLFRFILFFNAVLILILMSVLAVVYAVGFHIIGLLICFFLFSKLGSYVWSKSHRG